MSSGVSLDEIVDPLPITATDLDIRDLTHVTDSVKIGDGTDFLAIAADGSIAVTDNGGSLTVDAVDLDIRDLDHTTDDVSLGDGTNLLIMTPLDSVLSSTAPAIPISGLRQDAAGSPVSADGDAHPLVFNNDGELKVAADLTSDIADDAADAGNPIKIGGRAQDQGSALSVLSAAGDRFDLTGDLYRRLHTNGSHNVSMLNTAVSVGTTAAEVVAVPLDGRKMVTIQNVDNSADVYLGSSGSVTVANGIKIPKRSSATYDFGESIDIFLIASGTTTDVRILEAG